MKKTNTSNPLKYFNDQKAERLKKAQDGMQSQENYIKDLKNKGYVLDNKRAVEYNYTNSGPSDTLKVDHWFKPNGQYAGPLTSKPEINKSIKSKKK